MNTPTASLPGLTRRQAFRMSVCTAIASWLAPWQFAQAQSPGATPSTTPAGITPAAEPSGPYTLPPLPYAYEALEPNIDTLTMHLHHDRHHLAYVNNANMLLLGQPELSKMAPEQLLQNLDKAPENLRIGLQNNVGGHVNHSLFWQMMSPTGGGEPKGEIAKAIAEQFGSFEAFTKQLSAAALKRFGSGWAWLIKGKDGKLSIISTANQDSPVMDGNIPVLGLDVWEHAYYLKYQNLRANYISAWWNTVNWDFVNQQYAKTSV